MHRRNKVRIDLLTVLSFSAMLFLAYQLTKLLLLVF